MRTRLIADKIVLAFGIVALWLTVGASLSRADLFPPDVIDPSTLHIGGGVNNPRTDAFGIPGYCVAGGCPIWNGELNELTDPQLDVLQNSGGAGNLKNPLLLIFAVPNYDLVRFLFSGGAVKLDNPDLDASTVFSPAKLYKQPPGGFPWGSGTEPASTDVPVGFVPPAAYNLGSYVQGSHFSSSNIYDFLGLVGNDPNASNSFTNYRQALIDIPQSLFGFTIDPVDFFKIYVYTLSTGLLDAKDAVQVEFLHNYIYDQNGLPQIQGVPLGTFVTAWGITYKTVKVCTGTGPTKVCHYEDVPDQVWGTPITEAGIVMPAPPPPRVPEPTSILMLGSGLVFVGRLWRKRQRRNN